MLTTNRSYCELLQLYRTKMVKAKQTQTTNTHTHTLNNIHSWIICVHYVKVIEIVAK